MQRADFTGDAQQHRHRKQDHGQGNVVTGKILDQETAEGEQASANDQAFEKALMRSIKASEVATGRD